ncbi:acetyl-CoA acetyltransferase [Acidimicrobiia bacterium EGI L10123]|uniref:acetyl-CoA acetyltransferase n=1 Tax=Salinilacustrithrix flava TaxID=2957203 RepID=UPI003D7C28B2|nr:acetyl-CoA acetyltransferase [Acidimicrobiia bacterium EGI L10123]
MDPSSPVIVGVGQVANRSDDVVDALDLLEVAARAALGDAGGSLRGRLTSIVTQPISIADEDSAALLADRLDRPGAEVGIGRINGAMPQKLVAAACDAVRTGRHDAVLVAGALADASAVRLARSRPGAEDATWTGQMRGGDGGDRRLPPPYQVANAEVQAQSLLPAISYALLESVFAAEAGRTPAEQRAWLGEVLAPFTRAAARWPDVAWFPHERSAAEIAEVRADNRLVGEPYTKVMNAFPTVDQAAAVVVTTVGTARDAGVPADRMVFPWSAAACDEADLPSRRRRLARSGALDAVAERALGAAGIGADDLGIIDIYSCFPSAVQYATAALGIDPLDARGLSVTGGLPFFGGPGGNYGTHAIACLVERCREQPDQLAWASGLGGLVTSHAAGVYGGTPPPRGFRHVDCSDVEASLREDSVEIALDRRGRATVEAMTVFHDRDGTQSAAPVIVSWPDGSRSGAQPADPELASELVGRSLVGSEVRIAPGDEGTPRYELL